MLPEAAISLRQSLRDANRRLQSRIELLSGTGHSNHATHEQIAALLGELRRAAGEWLRDGILQTTDSAVQAEICEYRKNVEKLRDVLPLIHCRLLEERNRLKTKRARIDSAARWAKGSRQTL